MKYTILSIALTAFVLASCDRPQPDAAADESGAASPFGSLWLDAEPPGAITVTEARANPTPGTPVTIAGKIAGTLSPFTEGYATLVLADTTLATCDLTEDDECATPWDACCELPEKVAAARLSVQVVGDDGRPVPQTLKGANGLAELAPIVVTGTVADGSTAENLIVTATGIFPRP